MAMVWSDAALKSLERDCKSAHFTHLKQHEGDDDHEGAHIGQKRERRGARIRKAA